MYQVFNDAHFVDSAICGGTVASWSATRYFTYLKTLWKNTYLALNDAIEILDDSYTVTDTIDLPGSTAGAETVDIDKDGNIAVGVSISAESGNNGILKYDSSGVLQEDFFTPDEDWPVGKDTFLGVRFTHDSNYLYACLSGIGPNRIYKFNNTTGAEEWNITLDTLSYGIEIDSSDNVYAQSEVGVSAKKQIKKYAAADGSVLATYDTTTEPNAVQNYSRDIHIDEDLDRIYLCGVVSTYNFIPPITYYHLASVKFSDGSDLQRFQFQDSSVVEAWASVTKGSFLYVATTRCTHATHGTASVWKLNATTLAFVDNYDTGHSAAHIWLDWQDRVTVLGTAEDKIYVFDDDLGLDSSSTCTSSSSAHGNEGLSVPSGIAIGLTGSVTQTRNSWFPSDYCHLIGETVKEFVDGEILDEEVVDGDGNVTASGTNEHIGLAFTYKLKPMRLVFSARKGTNLGSIKHLNEMVVNFLDTLNARYGKTTDDLYDITWASASEFFSGDYVVALDSGFGKDDDVLISGDDPVPCNVRAMIPRVSVTGR